MAITHFKTELPIVGKTHIQTQLKDNISLFVINLVIDGAERPRAVTFFLLRMFPSAPYLHMRWNDGRGFRLVYHVKNCTGVV